MNRIHLALSAMLGISVLSASASEIMAGGLVGDFFREVGRATGIEDIEKFGNNLDDENRRVKQKVRVYGDLEENVAGGVRHVFKEATVESLGPVLAGLIEAGKADALNGNVEPLPPHVREAMSSYFGPEILDKVRWRVGGGDLTIQAGSIKLGKKDAITLDNIIVFRSSDLLESLHLVAHELGHVVQYHQWGISDFAKQYVRNYPGVEAAAERMANDWQAGKSNLAAAQPQPSPTPALSKPWTEPCMNDSRFECF